MIKEAIGVASTIDEARKIATQNLNAPLDADVKVEIISMPKKKVLGLFGGSDAKVKAFYDDGVEEVKKAPEKKQENKKAESKKDNKPAKKETPKMKEPETDLSGIEAKETDATNYLKSILVGMGFSDANVTVKETEEDLFFEITCGEDYGNIIGRRGETLDALQYLTRLYVNRADKDGKRVALNVGDYRKRREETLKALAKRQAQRAIKYRRSCVLEPMNPYERRIIHTAVQEISGVSSHSVGEGENRRVVIVSDDCDNQKRGGYSRDRRNNNGGRRERRPQYVPETPKEPREQKVDATGSSRYGKIEPKHTQGE
ncbi:MAG: protein jag [Clostridia bacterium]|nr:protein jag [Clostridia bacterium]MBR3809815.1 protein jag [Clostridia bacterium]